MKRDFRRHRIEDISKIVEGGKTTYSMEVKRASMDWKVLYDEQGTLLSSRFD